MTTLQHLLVRLATRGNADPDPIDPPIPTLPLPRSVDPGDPPSPLLLPSVPTDITLRSPKTLPACSPVLDFTPSDFPCLTRLTLDDPAHTIGNDTQPDSPDESRRLFQPSLTSSPTLMSAMPPQSSASQSSTTQPLTSPAAHKPGVGSSHITSHDDIHMRDDASPSKARAKLSATAPEPPAATTSNTSQLAVTVSTPNSTRKRARSNSFEVVDYTPPSKKECTDIPKQAVAKPKAESAPSSSATRPGPETTPKPVRKPSPELISDDEHSLREISFDFAASASQPSGACSSCGCRCGEPTSRRKWSTTLSPAIQEKLLRLIMGGVESNQRRVDPFSHIRKARPDLQSWEAVARAVGARGADMERVRQLSSRYMRELPAVIARGIAKGTL